MAEDPCRIVFEAYDSDDAATVDLFYDTDAEGCDGILIAEDLPEQDEQTVYDWTLDEDVPAGKFFIYARIQDGKNTPRFAYSEGRVEIRPDGVPLTPRGFQADQSGSGILTQWLPVYGDGDIGYRVLYTTKIDQSEYESSVAVGEETSLLLEDLSPAGTYRLTVVAYDEQGRQSPPATARYVQLEPSAQNSPPLITSRPMLETTVETEYLYKVEAMDADLDTLEWSLLERPSGMQINADSGLLTWTPSKYRVGVHEVKIKVADPDGGEDVQSFLLYVKLPTSGNGAPHILSTPPVRVEPGAVYQYQVFAQDPEGDTIDYRLIEKPAGMQIDSEGLVTWTAPSENGMVANVHLIVEDDCQGSDQQLFQIDVGDRIEEILGDIDSSGGIDASDLFLLGTCYDANNSWGDLYTDGKIDQLDLLEFLKQWQLKR